MVIAVRTETGPDGLFVVKTAGTDAERLSLAAEADALRRAAHPGVVEVVDHTPDELRLRHAGTTLSHLIPLAADHAAAVVCALAEVLDAIHEAGIAHGQIDADHVVVDRTGRPRLCGFGRATDLDRAGADAAADDVAALGALFDQLLDEAAHVPWTPDHAGARHRTRRKHAREVFRNVAGMAQRHDPRQRIAPHQMANAIRDALPGLELPVPPAPMVDTDGVPVPGVSDLPADADALTDIEWTASELDYLAGSADDDGDEVPGPDDAAPSVAPPSDSAPPEAAPDEVTPAAATTPATVSATASTAGSDGETTAAARERLERALAAGPPPITIRESELPAERRRRRPPPEEPAPRRNLVVLGVALFVAGVIIAPVLAWALGVFDGDDDAPVEAADASEADEGDAPDGTVVATTWPAECDLPALTGPDLDGDGCPEPVTVNGRNVMVGERPIAFGQEGDLIAVGDTDCDGVATPFLLRPSSGQVFVWPQWPLETEVEVRSSEKVAGATGIERRDGATCDVIVVTGAAETVVAGTP